jgi:hypothetical protein
MIAKPVRLVTEQHVIPAKRQQVAPITGFRMQGLADRIVQRLPKSLGLHLRHVIAVLVKKGAARPVPDQLLLVLSDMLKMKANDARIAMELRVIPAMP